MQRLVNLGREISIRNDVEMRGLGRDAMLGAAGTADDILAKHHT